MVNEFMVKNYRNVSIEKTELGRLNLLIGPNGSGKSNFLRALGFWAKVVQNNPRPDEGTTALYETLSQNGWGRMLNFESDSTNIEFSWVFSPVKAHEPYEYRLKLNMGRKTNNQLDFFISSEHLAYAKPKNQQHKEPYNFFSCHDTAAGKGLFSISSSDSKRITLSVRNNEVAFLQLNELRNADKDFDESYRTIYAERMNDLLTYLTRFYSFSCSEFDIRQVKKPVKTSLASFLTPDAGNLANLLQRWLYEEYDTSFFAYRQMITPLFSETHPVDIFIEPIPQTNTSQLFIGVRKQRYLLDDLSDGTIRAMILAALLVDRKEKMSVCTIDEPEMNLHPEWQNRFTDWLLTSNASQQFFVSSHSPEILDPLTPAFMRREVKVFVFSDDYTITELSPDRIADLYGKGFNLGDLYRAKAIEIGGWPK